MAAIVFFQLVNILLIVAIVAVVVIVVKSRLDEVASIQRIEKHVEEIAKHIENHHK